MGGLTTCGRAGELYKRECVDRSASHHVMRGVNWDIHSDRLSISHADPTTGTVDLDSLVYVYVRKVREILLVATW